MKTFIVIIVALAIGVGASFRFVPALAGKQQALTSLFSAKLSRPNDASTPVPVTQTRAGGLVMGASTRMNSLAETLASAANIGISAGANVLNSLSSTPSGEKDVIDVGKAVQQISDQVENIPSTVLHQAKISYCEQVLRQASASASPSAVQ